MASLSAALRGAQHKRKARSIYFFLSALEPREWVERREEHYTLRVAVAKSEERLQASRVRDFLVKGFM